MFFFLFIRPQFLVLSIVFFRERWMICVFFFERDSSLVLWQFLFCEIKNTENIKPKKEAKSVRSQWSKNGVNWTEICRYPRSRNDLDEQAWKALGRPTMSFSPTLTTRKEKNYKLNKFLIEIYGNSWKLRVRDKFRQSKWENTKLNAILEDPLTILVMHIWDAIIRRQLSSSAGEFLRHTAFDIIWEKLSACESSRCVNFVMTSANNESSISAFTFRLFQRIW